MAENFILDLIGSLQRSKSKQQINSDIKMLEKSINMLRLTATLAKKDTKKEINAYIKSLENQLSQVKLKAKIDSKNLKNDINKALNGVSFKDIDLLSIDESKTKLKIRKVIADTKAYVDKNNISIDIGMKKEKLNNDLTTYLNKNTKIKESSVLLEEADKLKALIDSIDDPKSLKEATTAFQLYKSEVSATGFAAKSTTDRIKGMLSHITKIGSFFGVASLAVNSFRKSLQTFKEVDTYLTEISKANDKLSKSDLAQIGNDSFDVASKYGKKATNYLSAVQEMSRAGYENAVGLSELSVAAQGAGDMTQELANQYIIATDKAYKLGGSVEKLTEVLDGSNYITNHNAVNMTELAEGMSIVGSQAASLGVEANQTTAVLGTMIATTQQSGSEMARAFRAILLNLQQVTDEEEGITAEGLTKYEAACKALNVSLKETKNGITSLRDPMEVIKDLAEEYSKLDANDIRRTNLLSSVGGKLRANALNALLENYSMYEKMLKEYADGTGSMAAEAEKTANSWEGRLNSLQNSWDSFVNSLTNKDAILGGISFFDRLIQGAEELTNVVGEIPILLASINGTMSAINKDYGISQLFNKETGKLDVQGNFMGIDITAIKAQTKHFAEAESAIATWNKELLKGKMDINDFGEAVVKNNAQLKAYLATTSKDAPASLNGYKSYLNEAGIATDALRLKTVLLNAAISFGIGLAIQFAVQGITNLIHATEEVRQKAQELGKEFSNTKSEIEDYKEKIEGLYKTINDSGSSIEDVTNARKTLMSVQDELIDKFGTEKSVINDVTDAINGQTDALDRLTQTKWQEIKNDFNDDGFWNGVANFFQGTDNIKRMLNEYGEKTILFRWADYVDINKLTDEMVAELENIGINIKVDTDNLQYIRDFDSLIESISDTSGASLALTGNAEEIYNQILALQNLIGNDDSFDKLYDKLESTANSYKDLTDQYKEFYNQYLLYEKILTDGSDYADTFKEITDVFKKYSNAFASCDEGKIKEASDKYASIISNAMATALENGDSDVADYFENMYPTLKSVVSSWEFDVAFDANTDDLQSKVQSILDDLKDENGRQLTAEEIFDLGAENQQYQDLVSIAHSYNMTLEEMIALLKERNLVSDMDYQGLVGLFGQEIIDSLTPEEIEIAYTIKNIGSLSFNELKTEIIEMQNKADEPIEFDINTHKDSIDNFQSKLKTLGDTLSSIRSGDFEDSDLTDLLQEFPELAEKTDDLETAIVELINNALQALYDTLGEDIPDGLKTSLQELADIASGTAKHLGDAFSDIHDSWDILHDFKDTMDKGFDSNVTDSLLQSVRKLSGELETLVAGYYSGVVTAEQLYEALTEHYENDLHNYSEALIKKNELNEEFYNAVGLADTKVVNQFNDNYGVDLENCKTYAEAKAKIELDTLDTISTSWSKYYDAQSKTFTREYKILEAQVTHGGGTQAELLEEINGKVAAYEAAMEALNNITYDGIRSNFEGIGSKLSANSRSSSEKDFEETFNWIETAIDRIERSISNLDLKASSVYRSWSERNSNLKAELLDVKKEMDIQASGYNRYMQQANSVGLSDEWASKVRNGQIDINSITDKALAVRIKEYQDWYRNMPLYLVTGGGILFNC